MVVDIFTQADRFQEEFIAGSETAERQVRLGYDAAQRAIEAELDRLLRKISEAEANGQPVSQAWLYQEQRLQKLRATTIEMIDKAARRSFVAVQNGQQQAAERGFDHTGRLVESQFSDTRIAKAELQGRFDELPKGIIDEVVGRLSDGSPLSPEYFGTGEALFRQFQDVLIGGVAVGKNPNAIRSQVQSLLGVSRGRAVTLARTEILNAQRESSRRAMEMNSDILTEWAWNSATDLRTCPICWYMHGQKFPLNQKMATHPNCRCSMLPITKGWEDLGFGPGVIETRKDLENGLDLFNALTPSQQNHILGPAKYALYKHGQIRLADLVVEGRHPRWGPYRRQRTLKEIGLTGRQVRELVERGRIRDASPQAVQTPTNLPESLPDLPTLNAPRPGDRASIIERMEELERRFRNGEIAKSTYNTQMYKMRKMLKETDAGVDPVTPPKPTPVQPDPEPTNLLPPDPPVDLDLLPPDDYLSGNAAMWTALEATGWNRTFDGYVPKWKGDPAQAKPRWDPDYGKDLLPYTHAQRDSIMFLKGQTHVALNKYLRKGTVSAPHTAAEFDEHIKNIDAAFENVSPLEQTLRLRRGITQSGGLTIDDFQEGGTFTEKAYMSTSTGDPEDRDRYNHAFFGDLVLDIYVPAGNKAMALSGLTEYKTPMGESEILLDRDSEFKILKVINNADEKRVVLEMIGKKKPGADFIEPPTVITPDPVAPPKVIPPVRVVPSDPVEKRRMELDQKEADLTQRFRDGLIKENTYKTQLYKINKERKALGASLAPPEPIPVPDDYILTPDDIDALQQFAPTNKKLKYVKDKPYEALYGKDPEEQRLDAEWDDYIDRYNELKVIARDVPDLNDPVKVNTWASAISEMNDLKAKIAENNRVRKNLNLKNNLEGPEEEELYERAASIREDPMSYGPREIAQLGADVIRKAIGTPKYPYKGGAMIEEIEKQQQLIDAGVGRSWRTQIRDQQIEELKREFPELHKAWSEGTLDEPIGGARNEAIMREVRKYRAFGKYDMDLEQEYEGKQDDIDYFNQHFKTSMIPTEWMEMSALAGSFTVERTGTRGGYQPGTGHMGIRGDDIDTIVHEMVHRMEATNKRVGELEQDFYTSRVGTEPIKQIPGYGPTELYRKDQFALNYIGKDYRQSPSGYVASDSEYWELLSMGIEHLTGTRGAPIEHAKISDRDFDFVKWVVGMLLVA